MDTCTHTDTNSSMDTRAHRIPYHRRQRHVEAIDTGEPEVRQLQLAIAGDEQVLRLEVPMDNAVDVQEVDAFQQLKHQILRQTDRL